MGVARVSSGITSELNHLRISILFVTCSKIKPNYPCLLTMHVQEKFYIQIHCISSDSAIPDLIAKWEHYKPMNLCFVYFIPVLL